MGLLNDNIQLKDTEAIHHKRFKEVLKMVELNIPVLLVGGAGTGKNHTLEQVAHQLDLDFYFSNAITQEYKLTGYQDAQGVYHGTQFYDAFTKGGLFMLDEIDGSIPEALLILNSAIANKYFDFPGAGRVIAHKDFRVVSAGNTAGTGADHVYVGRQQLDGATTDRFVIINFDYDEGVEEKLASNEDIRPFIYALRDIVEQRSLPFIFSLRAIINASKMDGVMTDEFVVRSAIFKGIPEDEVEQFLPNLPKNNRYTTATYKMLNLELPPEKVKDDSTKDKYRTGNTMQKIPTGEYTYSELMELIEF